MVGTGESNDGSIGRVGRFAMISIMRPATDLDRVPQTTRPTVPEFVPELRQIQAKWTANLTRV